MHSEVWDDETARTYDDDVAEMGSTEVVGPTVDLLAELAAGGRALEFAVGTGRIAIPLAQRGVDVVGIELSKPMIDRLRSKPGSERVRVIHGDMATTRADGSFSVVYLVFNTITTGSATPTTRSSCDGRRCSFGFRRCVFVTWTPSSVQVRDLSGPVCTDFMG